MFVRTTKVKGRDKTYVYAQLVEAYRREDGKPRQRIIASLGQLTALQVENLRVALKAAKDGQAVVRELVADDNIVVRRSLDYLPIAVVLRMARQIGLAELLAKLLDDGNTTVPVSEVVLALVANRLVAPGSKLAAGRWFERTALPEVLGVERSELNNSRVHRTLESLDKVRAELQLGLAALYRDPTEVGGALFIDVSDTWFEGRGPSLAQRHKTKEGASKKKVGIVLTVNKRGQPLRWQVVAGRRHDSQTMGDMARALAQIPWMSDLPMVFDRAMGKNKHLAELIDAGVRFITLLTSQCFAGYAWDDLDVPGLAAIESRDSDESQAQAAAVHAADAAGFVKVGRRLWAKDLGVRTHRKPTKTSSGQGGIRRASRQSTRARAAKAMRQAEELTRLKVEMGLRYADAAQQIGITAGNAGHRRRLMKLIPEIIEVVREERCSAPLLELERLALLPANEQRQAFEPYQIDASHQTDSPDAQQRPALSSSAPEIRVILVFDPVAFTAARATAAERDQALRDAFEHLDRRLADGRTTPQSVERKAGKLLSQHSLTDCYDVTTSSHGVTLRRRETVWQAKRRTDGFRVFALHPELTTTPAEALDLYSAKMAVEVDFHVIKSTVQIRPVHHKTDAKVRAHVDLCVLSVAIERALNAALPAELSAPAALEQLESVRMTEVAPNAQTTPTRVLTTVTPEQRKILKHLGMLDLTTLDSL